MYTSMQLVI